MKIYIFKNTNWWKWHLIKIIRPLSFSLTLKTWKWGTAQNCSPLSSRDAITDVACGGHFEYRDLRPFQTSNFKTSIIIRANTLSDQENKVLHKVITLLAPEMNLEVLTWLGCRPPGRAIILCLGCVSSNKFASLTQVAPGPNIASSVQTGPKAAFIIMNVESEKVSYNLHLGQIWCFWVILNQTVLFCP
jgi:hypothetical protein